MPATLRESLVAVVGALTLAYTAWCFAGVMAWSLHILLAGGLLTLLMAVVPWPSRRSGGDAAPADSPPAGKRRRRRGSRSGLGRLLRLPAFYLAAAFLGYLAIAAFNPAWEIASDSRGWWLSPVEPPLAAWLPASVEAAYEPMNAWRIFNLHLAAFTLALGLRVGLTRRRSPLLVLWTFLLSATAMAVVAIIQQTTGAERVLWTYASENQNFWGTFFYRNQGAAFLNWALIVGGALYFFHARRTRLEARTGGPHFLVFCLMALLVVSVGLALSRGGILFAAVLVSLFLCLVLFSHLIATLQSPAAVAVPITLTLLALLSVGLYQTYRAIDWEAVDRRFGDISATIEDADHDARVISSRLTWEMAQDALWTGWGAGSFRYAFPMYQQKVPELFYNRYHRRHGWQGRKFFRYAHNDILQFLAEYGIVGSSLLLAAVLSLLAAALSLPLLGLWLTAGLLVTCSHAFLDFIFHSPAVWVALIGSLGAASRLAQLEAARSRG